MRCPSTSSLTLTVQATSTWAVAVAVEDVRLGSTRGSAGWGWTCCLGATWARSDLRVLLLVLLDVDPFVVAVMLLCRVGVPPVSPVFRTHISMMVDDRFCTVQLTQYETQSSGRQWRDECVYEREREEGCYTQRNTSQSCNRRLASVAN